MGRVQNQISHRNPGTFCGARPGPGPGMCWQADKGNLAAHPDIAERPTTHLAAHGIKATPEAALEQLVSAFDSWLGVWASGAGFPEIASAWSERALTKNSPIRVKLADELLEGVYLGIDATGALMLELPDGSERCITTGDVFPL